MRIARKPLHRRMHARSEMRVAVRRDGSLRLGWFSSMKVVGDRRVRHYAEQIGVVEDGIR